MGRLKFYSLKQLWNFAALYFLVIACTPPAAVRREIDPGNTDYDAEVSAFSVSLAEGASGEILVRLSKALEQEIQIGYTTNPDTADSTDFTLPTGVLTFAVGETTKTISVEITDDAVYEGTEKFSVKLVTDANVKLPTTNAEVEILDNEAMPNVQFDASNASALETAGTQTIGLTLSNVAANPVNVSYSIGTSGTASGGGSDYTLASTGVITFSPGETTKSLSLPLIDDYVVESNETLELSLVSVSGAELGSMQHFTFTILDNDAPDTGNSSIAASGPVAANGVSTSTITVTLKNSSNEATQGSAVAISVSGSSNIVSACSTTNSMGVSTCTLSSIQAEEKTISVVTPAAANTLSTTVTFTQAVSAAKSSIAATGPVDANGTSTSTVTITLKDYANAGIENQSVDFSASGTGNSKGACTTTNSSGVATCTLASTKAQSKTLTLSTPDQPTVTTSVTFVAQPSEVNSTISVTEQVIANGSSAATITVTLKDYNNDPIANSAVAVQVSGSNNTLGVCSSTNSLGISTCSLTSTKAETKTVSIMTPAALSSLSDTVVFAPGDPSTVTSSITADTPIPADGSSTSTIRFVVKDVSSNPISGLTVNASVTGSNNTLSSCPATTNAAGEATCTLASTTVETKTVSILAPSALSSKNTSVEFVSTSTGADPAFSSISASGPSVVADGTSYSTITITLKDSSNNPVIGQATNFAVTGSGNSKESCSVTNASGVATCKFYSTVAELKTVSISTPATAGFSSITSSVTFTQAPNATYSSVSCSPSSVIANNSSSVSCTFTLKDYANTAIVGSTITGSSSAGGSLAIGVGACSGASDSSGQITCTFKASSSGTKTISMTSPSFSPASAPSTTINATSQSMCAATSTISGSGPVSANGTSTSTITITAKDCNGVVMSGQTVGFTSTGTNNTLGACSTTDGSGVSTCTLSSTTAQTKTITMTKGGTSFVSPEVAPYSTVVFNAAASPTNSVVSCTPTSGILANNKSYSTCTLTLKDYSNNAMTATSVAATTSAGSTIYIDPSSACSGNTDSLGRLQCRLKASSSGTKTVTMSTPNFSPSAQPTGTVDFSSQTICASTSTISGSGPVVADGASTSTITITAKDCSGEPMSGQTVGFTATGSNNSLGACSSTDDSGISTCTLSSTSFGTNTITMTKGATNFVSPEVAPTGSVTFTRAVSPTYSTLSCSPTSVIANNNSTSTCTATIKDYANAAYPSGTSVAMTTTGATLTASGGGACSGTTDSSGQYVCLIKASTTGLKSVTLSTPSLSPAPAGSVTFTAQTVCGTISGVARSTISATAAAARGSEVSSTVTITAKDCDGQPVSGQSVGFTSSGTSNTLGACSTTNASGVSTCTLSTTVAETKTLTMTKGTSFTSPESAPTTTVAFTQYPNGPYSTLTCPASVASNGTATGTCSFTVRDYNNAVMSGVATYLTSTGSNNTISCTSSSTVSTNASGQNSCTIKSTTAETKTISLAFTSYTLATAKTAQIVFGTPAVLAFTTSSTSYVPEGNFLFDRLSTGTTQNLTVTVKNTGAIQATSLADAAGLAAPFTYTGGSYPGSGATCGTTLNSSSTCTLSLTFSPTSAVTSSDQIALNYNDGTASQTATSNMLYGTGLGETKMTASSPDGDQQFGRALAMSGNVAIIGGPYGAGLSQALVTGSAAIYRMKTQSGVTSLQKEADLTRSATQAGDQFGFSADISGDYAIVGAPRSDEQVVGGQSTKSDAGAATIFQFNGTSWVERVKLFTTCSTNGDPTEDEFGYSVAIDGMKAIVGNPYDFYSNQERGSVSLYVYTGSTWDPSCIGTTTAQRTQGSEFGYSVDISGDVAVVGAPGENKAYLFKYAGGSSWTAIQTLAPSDLAAGDRFGEAVSIKGDVVAVGAPLQDGNTANVGAVYIYRNVQGDSSFWSYVLERKESGSSIFGNAYKLGNSLSVSDDAVAAWSGYYSPNNTVHPNGVVSLFRFYNNSWVAQKNFSPSDTSKIITGPVAISGTSLLVGDYDDTVSSKTDAGSVLFYNNADIWTNSVSVTTRSPAETNIQANEAANGGVSGDVAIGNSLAAVTTYSSSTRGVNLYRFNNSGWTLEQKVNDTTFTTFASGAIALWNNYLIVGNKNESNGGTANYGSFSIFKKSSNAGQANSTNTLQSTWQRVASAFPPSGAANTKYGSSVAIYGDVAAIAAASNASGAANISIYRKSSTSSETWTNETTLSVLNLVCGFGSGSVCPTTLNSISLYGHFLAVSFSSSYSGTTFNDVEVYIYNPANTSWALYDSATKTDNSGWGSVVSLSDGLLVVSSSSTKTVRIYRNQGSVNKFNLEGTGEATLTRPSSEDGNFGADIAVNNGLVLVGAPGGTGSATGINKGHAYLYRFVIGSGWKLGTDNEVPGKEITFNPSYADKDQFGAKVGISESMAIIGVGDQSATEFNKAYIYPVGP